MVLNEYVVVNGKRLRKGYTTGSCAAAAARAATRMLFSQSHQEYSEIQTPRGKQLVLPVENVQILPGCAVCSVQKDGGDDPDVTTGLQVFAQAEVRPEGGIEICGGRGVGIVTKPGLEIPVGEPAINPVPRRMITEEVKKELPPGQGVRITVFVPHGEEIARKTFNPRLGIEGGISILGTTGIVEPMSEEALQQALIMSVRILAEKGLHRAILVPGKYGENFAVSRLGLPSELIVMTSNFIGALLDSCVDNGIRDILLVGHIGKLIKVAGGIFHTHSRVADARMEILAAFAALYGADQGTIAGILRCTTTQAALDILKSNNLQNLYPYIAARVSARCRERTKNKANIGTIMYSQDGTILAMDEVAGILREGFVNDED